MQPARAPETVQWLALVRGEPEALRQSADANPPKWLGPHWINAREDIAAARSPGLDEALSSAPQSNSARMIPTRGRGRAPFVLIGDPFARRS